MFDLSILDVPLDAPLLGNTSDSPALTCVCCNCDRIRIRFGEWSDYHTPLAGERRFEGYNRKMGAERLPDTFKWPGTYDAGL